MEYLEKVFYDGKIGPAMIGTSHLLGEVETLFTPRQEMADGDTRLVAKNLSIGHVDGCRPMIILCKGSHVKTDGCMVFHLSNHRLMVYYIIVTMIDTSAIGTMLQLFTQHIIESLPLRHIEIANPFTATPIEINSREGTTTLHLTIDTTGSRAFWSIVSTKPAERTKRRHSATRRLNNPQQEVEVVATLREQHRISLLATTEHPTDIAVGHAVNPHSLCMPNGHDATESARINQSLYLSEAWHIAKHMAYSYVDMMPTSLYGNLLTLSVMLCYRLLQQYVHTLSDSSDGRSVVMSLWSSDKDCICCYWMGKEVLVVEISGLSRQTEEVGHVIASLFIRFHDSYQCRLVGMSQHIFNICTHAIAGSDSYYPNRQPHCIIVIILHFFLSFDCPTQTILAD